MNKTIFAALLIAFSVQSFAQGPKVIFEALEQAHIHAVENGNDTASITKLFYEASHPAIASPVEINSRYFDILCPFMVKAEQGFRNGTSHGVTAKQLAKTYNDLVTTFALPEEAKVSEADLIEYRHSIAKQVPNFVLYHALSKDPDGSRTFKDEMSPMVAFYEIANVFNAKLLSRTYAVTPADRAAALKTFKETGVMPVKRYQGDDPKATDLALLGSPSSKNGRFSRLSCAPLLQCQRLMA